MDICKVTLLILSFFSFSCHQIVQTDFPDFEKAHVVNAILRSGDSIKLHLSTTSAIGGRDYELIDNAEISVYENNILVDVIANPNSGLYVSDIVAKPATSYTFEIIAEGYETLTLVDSIPATPEIIEVKHITKAGRDEEGAYYPAVEVTFKNKPQNLQCYEVDVIQHRTCYDWESGERYPCSVGFGEELWMPEIEDPVLLNESIEIPLFSNLLIENDTYKLHINYTSGNRGRSNGEPWAEQLYPLSIELRAVSEAYYNYKKSLLLHEVGNFADGFGQSVQAIPLYSNVEYGYGIVAGYSYCNTDTIIPEPYDF